MPRTFDHQATASLGHPDRHISTSFSRIHPNGLEHCINERVGWQSCCQNCGMHRHKEAKCNEACPVCGSLVHTYTGCDKKEIGGGMCRCTRFPEHLAKDCLQKCRHCGSLPKDGCRAMQCKFWYAVCGELNSHAGWECRNKGKHQPSGCGEYHLGQTHIRTSSTVCKAEGCGRYHCPKHTQVKHKE
jgi:hypothetical protein